MGEGFAVSVAEELNVDIGVMVGGPTMAEVDDPTPPLDQHEGSISYITYCDLTINRVWSVLALSQKIQNFSHVPSCSLGSYYPRTVDLSSPKLNAYKPELGPLLLVSL